MPNTSTPPPPVEFEREIRQLYHERNSKAFDTPVKTPGGRRWFSLEMLIILVVATLVSTAVSIIVTSLTNPLGSPTTIERVVRGASPAVDTLLRDEVVRRLSQGLVVIYSARGATKGASPTEGAYLASEALGQGLVLSSDGWLVTTRAVVPDIKRNLTVLTADGKSYAVERAAVDAVAPFIYLKIPATNLVATAFAHVTDLAAGQDVLVLARTTQVVTPEWYPRSLSSLAAPQVATREALNVSSEILPDRYLVDRALPTGTLGAPVVTTAGEVIGLLDQFRGETRAIVPLEVLAGVIDRLFTSGTVHRPSLGITYAQAAWTVPFLPSGSAAFRGALVTGLGRGAPAGLKLSDQVIAISGELVNGQSLSAVLQQFRAGDKVELSLLRAGKELKLPVTLGDTAPVIKP